MKLWKDLIVQGEEVRIDLQMEIIGAEQDLKMIPGEGITGIQTENLIDIAETDLILN